MSIILSQPELDQLNALYLGAKTGGGYWKAYEYLATVLESHGVISTDPVLLWQKGATEAKPGAVPSRH